MTRRQQFLSELSDTEVLALRYNWPFWARPEQLAPDGDWTIWLILAGRGFGKTRTGAETVRHFVESGAASRIALVAEDSGDARDVMVEGESGIMAISAPWFRPEYQPSKRRIVWPNGALATIYSADDPEALRGPQHDFAWCDELAKWRYARETWDQLQFGLRLGLKPRQIVTTTPRPISVLKEIMARSDMRLSTGKTADNEANLAPNFLASIVGRYQGTRLGRQELGGELLEDVAGALWTRALIDAAQRGSDNQPLRAAPDLARIVVAIDPSGTAGEGEGDDIGIVAVGHGVDGIAYVLADVTCQASPAVWGKVAVDLYHKLGANLIVGERNFGGAMVAHVIRTVDPDVAYKEVVASRGKWLRAEPIAALYEQNRVKHVGSFAALEDEMCAFAPTGLSDGKSPNRLDALVWALTELALTDGSTVFQANEADILGEPFDIPRHWPRVFALDVDRNRIAAVWGAVDRAGDTAWLYGEYVARRGDLASQAAAIKDRCKSHPDLEAWIPGVFDHRARKRSAEEGDRIVNRLLDLKIDLFTADAEAEVTVGEMATRLSAKRLRVFKTMPEWLAEYRNYRRDKDGTLAECDDGLMRATGLLCLSGIHCAVTDRVLDQETRDELDAATRDSVTGY